MKIEFIADKVKINGPKIDGTYTISFDVGEYAYDQIMHLPKMNGSAMYLVVTDEEPVQDGNKGNTKTAGNHRA